MGLVSKLVHKSVGRAWEEDGREMRNIKWYPCYVCPLSAMLWDVYLFIYLLS